MHYPQEYGSNGGAGVGYGRLVYGDYLTGETLPADNIITRIGLGGIGGGALEIHTTHLRVDGKVHANGQVALALSAGGGSGGSISKLC